MAHHGQRLRICQLVEDIGVDQEEGLQGLLQLHLQQVVTLQLYNQLQKNLQHLQISFNKI